MNRQSQVDNMMYVDRRHHAGEQVANVNAFKRLIGGGCLALAITILSSGNVHGEDWIFARSYFSHRDSPGYQYGIAPQPESAYRHAYRNPGPHNHIRGGYRINNIRIFNGSNSDIQYDREAWYDVQ